MQNKEEAPIIKLIFDLRLKEKLSPGKIARRLDALGIKTYMGSPEWSGDTVKDILTNPIHAGKVRWNNRITVKTMEDGKLVSSRPRSRSSRSDHYMLYDGKHKDRAIIDWNTFQETQKGFYTDRTKSKLKLRNILAGILVCKNCGRVMAMQNYSRRGNVAARYSHYPSQICKVKSAMASDVIDAVRHSLKLHIEDFELKISNTPQVDENSLTIQIEALEKEKKKILKILDKLYAAWEDDTLTDNEFVQRKAVNRSRIEEIENQIEELESSIPEQEEYEDVLLRLSDALDAIDNDYITPAERNEFLRNILEKIEFSRENDKEFILDVYLRH